MHEMCKNVCFMKQNKLTLLALQGIPACGKSTIALKLVAEDNSYVRVNQDDMRLSYFNRQFEPKDEPFIYRMNLELTRQALAAGKNVVNDNTNFNPKTLKALEAIANEFGAEFKVQRVNISKGEALRRDEIREMPVGKKVINFFWEKYITPELRYKTPTFDPNKKDAIVVDLDGTLAHISEKGRSFFEYHKVDEDIPDKVICSLVRQLSQNHAIIIVSGRENMPYNDGEESTESITKGWLKRHNIPYDKFFLRRNGDKRKDYDVKQELFFDHIEPLYNVIFSLDDRNQSVKCWRDLGIKTLQVEDGDF